MFCCSKFSLEGKYKTLFREKINSVRFSGSLSFRRRRNLRKKLHNSVCSSYEDFSFVEMTRLGSFAIYAQYDNPVKIPNFNFKNNSKENLRTFVTMPL